LSTAKGEQAERTAARPAATPLITNIRPFRGGYRGPFYGQNPPPVHADAPFFGEKGLLGETGLGRLCKS
jgi:hypothetical protein